MMKTKYFFQVLLVALAMTILYFLLDLLFGQISPQALLLWNFVANILIAGVLAFYVMHSGFQSRKLWLATFAIFYIIGSFNLVIEGFIFGVVDSAMLIKSMLFGIPYTLIGSYIVIRIFKRQDQPPVSLQSFLPRKVFGWVWRVLAANFLYVVFYIIAGTLVEIYTPGFEEFYEGKLPSMETFFITNMGFRGFVFVSIAILIDRSVHASKMTKALLVGLVFSIIGGIAPLIPPSETMPQFLRIAHGFEVGISNFLYGVSVFLIIRSKPKQPSTA